MQCPKCGESFETITLGGMQIVIRIDDTIPGDEVHVKDGGKVVGKIINIGNQPWPPKLETR